MKAKKKKAKKKATRAKAKRRKTAAKKRTAKRLDSLLDSELEDTFPASDPVEPVLVVTSTRPAVDTQVVASKSSLSRH